ncbi:hypothetical protein RND81_13G035500 [Saponaria officinalis]|uniref:RING-type domain-containing protein n=1 Tax=Saponaria officinalis TaxID=3572 RepID=A0AAW1GTV3_SAPOF
MIKNTLFISIMEFSLGYNNNNNNNYHHTKEILPNLFLKFSSFLTLLKTLFFTIINLLGLTHLIEPEIHWAAPDSKPISAVLIQEMLPAVEFRDLGLKPDQVDNCAICLHEFKNRDEIRKLQNCKHIFHRTCVDRWMEQDQRNCPLCRTSLVPNYLINVFNKRLLEDEEASSSFPEFGSEFCVINTFL